MKPGATASHKRRRNFALLSLTMNDILTGQSALVTAFRALPRSVLLATVVASQPRVHTARHSPTLFILPTLPEANGSKHYGRVLPIRQRER